MLQSARPIPVHGIPGLRLDPSQHFRPISSPQLPKLKKPGPGGASSPGGPSLAYAPFDPSAPPPTGTYDPAIDAQANQAGRSAGYATEDANTGISRAQSDYAVANEDLGRRYNFLANSQNQAARAAGVDGGGWVQQSAGKRTDNKGREQGALSLALQRQVDDYSRSITRAGRENEAYQSDAQTARVAQATQQGWSPFPEGPTTIGNHRVDPREYKDGGGVYHLARDLRTHKIVKIRPNGTIEPR